MRLRRADETAVRRALKLHHLAQRGLGRDGAVGMHDEQRVRLAVRVQRDLFGQAGRCRGGLGHRVGDPPGGIVASARRRRGNHLHP